MWVFTLHTVTENTGTETRVSIQVIEKRKSCSALMGSLVILLQLYGLYVEDQHPGIILLKEKYVRQMSTLHCPVQQKQSKAFLGYYTVLCCVSNGLLVYCAPSFCVQSKALSH